MAKDAVAGRVRVNVGEYMVYRTLEGGQRSRHGNFQETGGWFKAKSDESLDYNNPVLCKVLEEVTYDEREGARDGTFKRQDVKRCWSDDSRPAEITERSDEAAHNKFLTHGMVDAGREFAGR